MLARNGLTSDKSSCPLATATGPRKSRKLGIAWNLKFVPGKHGITWNFTFFKVKPWKIKFYKIIQILQFVPMLYKKIQITEFVDRKLTVSHIKIVRRLCIICLLYWWEQKRLL